MKGEEEDGEEAGALSRGERLLESRTARRVCTAQPALPPTRHPQARGASDLQASPRVGRGGG